MENSAFIEDAVFGILGIPRAPYNSRTVQENVDNSEDQNAGARVSGNTDLSACSTAHSSPQLPPKLFDGNDYQPDGELMGHVRADSDSAEVVDSFQSNESASYVFVPATGEEISVGADIEIFDDDESSLLGSEYESTLEEGVSAIRIEPPLSLSENCDQQTSSPSTNNQFSVTQAEFETADKMGHLHVSPDFLGYCNDASVSKHYMNDRSETICPSEILINSCISPEKGLNQTQVEVTYEERNKPVFSNNCDSDFSFDTFIGRLPVLQDIDEDKIGDDVPKDSPSLLKCESLKDFYETKAHLIASDLEESDSDKSIELVNKGLSDDNKDPDNDEDYIDMPKLIAANEIAPVEEIYPNPPDLTPQISATEGCVPPKRSVVGIVYPFSRASSSTSSKSHSFSSNTVSRQLEVKSNELITLDDTLEIRVTRGNQQTSFNVLVQNFPPEVQIKEITQNFQRETFDFNTNEKTPADKNLICSKHSKKVLENHLFFIGNAKSDESKSNFNGIHRYKEPINNVKRNGEMTSGMKVSFSSSMPELPIDDEETVVRVVKSRTEKSHSETNCQHARKLTGPILRSHQRLDLSQEIPPAGAVSRRNGDKTKTTNELKENIKKNASTINPEMTSSKLNKLKAGKIKNVINATSDCSKDPLIDNNTSSCDTHRDSKPALKTNSLQCSLSKSDLLKEHDYSATKKVSSQSSVNLLATSCKGNIYNKSSKNIRSIESIKKSSVTYDNKSSLNTYSENAKMENTDLKRADVGETCSNKKIHTKDSSSCSSSFSTVNAVDSPLKAFETDSSIHSYIESELYSDYNNFKSTLDFGKLFDLSPNKSVTQSCPDLKQLNEDEANNLSQERRDGRQLLSTRFPQLTITPLNAPNASRKEGEAIPADVNINLGNSSLNESNTSLPIIPPPIVAKHSNEQCKLTCQKQDDPNFSDLPECSLNVSSLKDSSSGIDKNIKLSESSPPASFSIASLIGNGSSTLQVSNNSLCSNVKNDNPLLNLDNSTVNYQITSIVQNQDKNENLKKCQSTLSNLPDLSHTDQSIIENSSLLDRDLSPNTGSSSLIAPSCSSKKENISGLQEPLSVAAQHLISRPTLLSLEKDMIDPSLSKFPEQILKEESAFDLSVSKASEFTQGEPVNISTLKKLGNQKETKQKQAPQETTQKVVFNKNVIIGGTSVSRNNKQKEKKIVEIVPLMRNNHQEEFITTSSQNANSLKQNKKALSHEKSIEQICSDGPPTEHEENHSKYLSSTLTIAEGTDGANITESETCSVDIGSSFTEDKGIVNIEEQIMADIDLEKEVIENNINNSLETDLPDVGEHNSEKSPDLLHSCSGSKQSIEGKVITVIDGPGNSINTIELHPQKHFVENIDIFVQENKQINKDSQAHPLVSEDIMVSKRIDNLCASMNEVELKDFPEKVISIDEVQHKDSSANKDVPSTVEGISNSLSMPIHDVILKSHEAANGEVPFFEESQPEEVIEESEISKMKVVSKVAEEISKGYVEPIHNVKLNYKKAMIQEMAIFAEKTQPTKVTGELGTSIEKASELSMEAVTASTNPAASINKTGSNNPEIMLTGIEISQHENANTVLEVSVRNEELSATEGIIEDSVISTNQNINESVKNSSLSSQGLIKKDQIVEPIQTSVKKSKLARALKTQKIMGEKSTPKLKIANYIVKKVAKTEKLENNIEELMVSDVDSTQSSQKRKSHRRRGMSIRKSLRKQSGKDKKIKEDTSKTITELKDEIHKLVVVKESEDAKEVEKDISDRTNNLPEKMELIHDSNTEATVNEEVSSINHSAITDSLTDKTCLSKMKSSLNSFIVEGSREGKTVPNESAVSCSKKLGASNLNLNYLPESLVGNDSRPTLRSQDNKQAIPTIRNIVRRNKSPSNKCFSSGKNNVQNSTLDLNLNKEVLPFAPNASGNKPIPPLVNIKDFVSLNKNERFCKINNHSSANEPSPKFKSQNDMKQIFNPLSKDKPIPKISKIVRGNKCLSLPSDDCSKQLDINSSSKRSNSFKPLIGSENKIASFSSETVPLKVQHLDKSLLKDSMSTRVTSPHVDKNKVNNLSILSKSVLELMYENSSDELKVIPIKNEAIFSCDKLGKTDFMTMSPLQTLPKEPTTPVSTPHSSSSEVANENPSQSMEKTISNLKSLKESSISNVEPNSLAKEAEGKAALPTEAKLGEKLPRKTSSRPNQIVSSNFGKNKREKNHSGIPHSSKGIALETLTEELHSSKNEIGFSKNKNSEVATKRKRIHEAVTKIDPISNDESSKFVQEIINPTQKNNKSDSIKDCNFDISIVPFESKENIEKESIVPSRFLRSRAFTEKANNTKVFSPEECPFNDKSVSILSIEVSSLDNCSAKVSKLLSAKKISNEVHSQLSSPQQTLSTNDGSISKLDLLPLHKKDLDKAHVKNYNFKDSSSNKKSQSRNQLLRLSVSSSKSHLCAKNDKASTSNCAQIGSSYSSAQESKSNFLKNNNEQLPHLIESRLNFQNNGIENAPEQSHLEDSFQSVDNEPLKSNSSHFRRKNINPQRILRRGRKGKVDRLQNYESKSSDISTDAGENKQNYVEQKLKNDEETEAVTSLNLESKTDMFDTKGICHLSLPQSSKNFSEIIETSIKAEISKNDVEKVSFDKASFKCVSNEEVLQQKVVDLNVHIAVTKSFSDSQVQENCTSIISPTLENAGGKSMAADNEYFQNNKIDAISDSVSLVHKISHGLGDENVKGNKTDFDHSSHINNELLLLNHQNTKMTLINFSSETKIAKNTQSKLEVHTVMDTTVTKIIEDKTISSKSLAQELPSHPESLIFLNDPQTSPIKTIRDEALIPVIQAENSGTFNSDPQSDTVISDVSSAQDLSSQLCLLQNVKSQQSGTEGMISMQVDHEPHSSLEHSNCVLSEECTQFKPNKGEVQIHTKSPTRVPKNDSLDNDEMPSICETTGDLKVTTSAEVQLSTVQPEPPRSPNTIQSAKEISDTSQQYLQVQPTHSLNTKNHSERGVAEGMRNMQATEKQLFQPILPISCSKDKNLHSDSNDQLALCKVTGYFKTTPVAQVPSSQPEPPLNSSENEISDEMTSLHLVETHSSVREPLECIKVQRPSDDAEPEQLKPATLKNISNFITNERSAAALPPTSKQSSQGKPSQPLDNQILSEADTFEGKTNTHIAEELLSQSIFPMSDTKVNYLDSASDVQLALCKENENVKTTPVAQVPSSQPKPPLNSFKIDNRENEISEEMTAVHTYELPSSVMEPLECANVQQPSDDAEQRHAALENISTESVKNLSLSSQELIKKDQIVEPIQTSVKKSKLARALKTQKIMGKKSTPKLKIANYIVKKVAKTEKLENNIEELMVSDVDSTQSSQKRKSHRRRGMSIRKSLRKQSGKDKKIKEDTSKTITELKDEIHKLVVVKESEDAKEVEKDISDRTNNLLEKMELIHDSNTEATVNEEVSSINHSAITDSLTDKTCLSKIKSSLNSFIVEGSREASDDAEPEQLKPATLKNISNVITNEGSAAPLPPTSKQSSQGEPSQPLDNQILSEADTFEGTTNTHIAEELLSQPVFPMSDTKVNHLDSASDDQLALCKDNENVKTTPVAQVPSLQPKPLNSCHIDHSENEISQEMRSMDPGDLLSSVREPLECAKVQQPSDDAEAEHLIPTPLENISNSVITNEGSAICEDVAVLSPTSKQSSQGEPSQPLDTQNLSEADTCEGKTKIHTAEEQLSQPVFPMSDTKVNYLDSASEDQLTLCKDNEYVKTTPAALVPLSQPNSLNIVHSENETCDDMAAINPGTPLSSDRELLECANVQQPSDNAEPEHPIPTPLENISTSVITHEGFALCEDVAALSSTSKQLSQGEPSQPLNTQNLSEADTFESKTNLHTAKELLSQPVLPMSDSNCKYLDSDSNDLLALCKDTGNSKTTPVAHVPSSQSEPPLNSFNIDHSENEISYEMTSLHPGKTHSSVREPLECAKVQQPSDDAELEQLKPATLKNISKIITDKGSATVICEDVAALPPTSKQSSQGEPSEPLDTQNHSEADSFEGKTNSHTAEKVLSQPVFPMSDTKVNYLDSVSDDQLALCKDNENVKTTPAVLVPSSQSNSLNIVHSENEISDDMTAINPAAPLSSVREPLECANVQQPSDDAEPQHLLPTPLENISNSVITNEGSAICEDVPSLSPTAKQSSQGEPSQPLDTQNLSEADTFESKTYLHTAKELLSQPVFPMSDSKGKYLDSDSNGQLALCKVTGNFKTTPGAQVPSSQPNSLNIVHSENEISDDMTAINPVAPLSSVREPLECANVQQPSDDAEPEHLLPTPLENISNSVITNEASGICEDVAALSSTSKQLSQGEPSQPLNTQNLSEADTFESKTNLHTAKELLSQPVLPMSDSNCKYLDSDSNDQLALCKVTGNFKTTPGAQVPSSQPEPPLNSSENEISDEMTSLHLVETHSSVREPLECTKVQHPSDDAEPEQLKPATLKNISNVITDEGSSNVICKDVAALSPTSKHLNVKSSQEEPSQPLVAQNLSEVDTFEVKTNTHTDEELLSQPMSDAKSKCLDSDSSDQLALCKDAENAKSTPAALVPSSHPKSLNIVHSENEFSDDMSSLHPDQGVTNVDIAEKPTGQPKSPITVSKTDYSETKDQLSISEITEDDATASPQPKLVKPLNIDHSEIESSEEMICIHQGQRVKADLLNQSDSDACCLKKHSKFLVPRTQNYKNQISDSLIVGEKSVAASKTSEPTSDRFEDNDCDAVVSSENINSLLKRGPIICYTPKYAPRKSRKKTELEPNKTVTKVFEDVSDIVKSELSELVNNATKKNQRGSNSSIEDNIESAKIIKSKRKIDSFIEPLSNLTPNFKRRKIIKEEPRKTFRKLNEESNLVTKVKSNLENVNISEKTKKDIKVKDATNYVTNKKPSKRHRSLASKSEEPPPKRSLRSMSNLRRHKEIPNEDEILYSVEKNASVVKGKNVSLKESGDVKRFKDISPFSIKTRDFSICIPNANSKAYIRKLMKKCGVKIAYIPSSVFNEMSPNDRRSPRIGNYRAIYCREFYGRGSKSPITDSESDEEELHMRIAQRGKNRAQRIQQASIRKHKNSLNISTGSESKVKNNIEKDFSSKNKPEIQLKGNRDISSNYPVRSRTKCKSVNNKNATIKVSANLDNSLQNQLLNQPSTDVVESITSRNLHEEITIGKKTEITTSRNIKADKQIKRNRKGPVVTTKRSKSVTNSSKPETVPVKEKILHLQQFSSNFDSGSSSRVNIIQPQNQTNTSLHQPEILNNRNSYDITFNQFLDDNDSGEESEGLLAFLPCLRHTITTEIKDESSVGYCNCVNDGTSQLYFNNYVEKLRLLGATNSQTWPSTLNQENRVPSPGLTTQDRNVYLIGPSKFPWPSTLCEENRALSPGLTITYQAHPNSGISDSDLETTDSSSSSYESHLSSPSKNYKVRTKCESGDCGRRCEAECLLRWIRKPRPFPPRTLFPEEDEAALGLAEEVEIVMAEEDDGPYMDPSLPGPSGLCRNIDRAPSPEDPMICTGRATCRCYECQDLDEDSGR